MKKLTATVVSVSAGGNDDLSKDQQDSIEVELNGIVGDHHAGPSREAWSSVCPFETEPGDVAEV